MNITIIVALGLGAVLGLGTTWFLSRQMSSASNRLLEPERLANLLVTELALYNQEAMEALEHGTETPEMIEGLQRDIGRARQAFEERIEESHAAVFDHALTTILAKHDPRTIQALELKG